MSFWIPGGGGEDGNNEVDSSDVHTLSHKQTQMAPYSLLIRPGRRFTGTPTKQSLGISGEQIDRQKTTIASPVSRETERGIVSRCGNESP